jgi:hypothetical protein
MITESATAPSSSASGWSSSAPTSFTFSSEGSKTAYAWTKDAAGNVSAAKSAITAITLPSLTVASPVAGATVSGTVSIKTNVSASLVLSRVLFYVDGALRASDTKAPFSYNWNTKTSPNGSHTVMIKGYDSSGNVQQQSVSVTVQN